MTDSFSYRLIERLAEDHPDSSASEMHGALSGMLCTNPGLAYESWLQALFAEEIGALNEGDHDVLRKLYESTRAELTASDLSFELLLPDDEDSLAERARALGNWCQGFLFGLAQQAGERHWSEESEEVLRDFAEISRLVSEGSSEEDEEAYTEIAEYVRMGVQLIRSEFEAVPRQRLH